MCLLDFVVVVVVDVDSVVTAFVVGGCGVNPITTVLVDGGGGVSGGCMVVMDMVLLVFIRFGGGCGVVIVLVLLAVVGFDGDLDLDDGCNCVAGRVVAPVKRKNNIQICCKKCCHCIFYFQHTYFISCAHH